jgi:hypothetical protein
VLKRHQEDYDRQLLQKKKYNQAILKGEFLSSDSEDEVQVIRPPRTASSLQQNWSKFLMPNVSKFIGVTTKHPKLNGEGKCIIIFLSVLLSN